MTELKSVKLPATFLPICVFYYFNNLIATGVL